MDKLYQDDILSPKILSLWFQGVSILMYLEASLLTQEGWF